MCNMTVILDQLVNKENKCTDQHFIKRTCKLGSHLRKVAYQNDYKMVLC